MYFTSKDNYYKSNYINHLIHHFKDSLLKKTNKYLRYDYESIHQLSSDGYELKPRIENQIDQYDSLYRNIKSLKGKRYPCVFRRSVNDWPAIKIWSIDYFKKKYGDDICGFQTLSNIFENEEDNYLRFYNLFQRHPEELRNIDLELFYKNVVSKPVIDQGFQFFVSPHAGTKTFFHNANDSNFFVQISGQKKWIFYESKMSALFEPEPTMAEYRLPNTKLREIDPFDKISLKSQRFSDTNSFEVILNPGDILYVPPYVWHSVLNLTGNNIGFGYRWLSPLECINTEPIFFLLDLLASNPPIYKSIFMARRDFMKIFISQQTNYNYYQNKFKKYLDELNNSHTKYLKIIGPLRRKYQII